MLLAAVLPHPGNATLWHSVVTKKFSPTMWWKAESSVAARICGRQEGERRQGTGDSRNRRGSCHQSWKLLLFTGCPSAMEPHWRQSPALCVASASHRVSVLAARNGQRATGGIGGLLRVIEALPHQLKGPDANEGAQRKKLSRGYEYPNRSYKASLSFSHLQSTVKTRQSRLPGECSSHASACIPLLCAAHLSYTG